MKLYQFKTKKQIIFFTISPPHIYFVTRPQALTCQGRRRSAAAAHAKGPARPVMQSAFRDAKCFSCEGALAQNPQIFKFFDVYTATFFQNPCCAARGHAIAVCISLLAPLARSNPTQSVGQTRSAPRNSIKQFSLAIVYFFDKMRSSLYVNDFLPRQKNRR